MKSLSNFCQERNLIYKTITFRHAAAGVKLKRKGFDIKNQHGQVLAELQPVEYSNGDRWLINYASNRTGLFYSKNIRQALKRLQPLNNTLISYEL